MGSLHNILTQVRRVSRGGGDIICSRAKSSLDISIGFREGGIWSAIIAWKVLIYLVEDS